jgi:hypothetical protein
MLRLHVSYIERNLRTRVADAAAAVLVLAILPFALIGYGTGSEKVVSIQF